MAKLRKLRTVYDGNKYRTVVGPSLSLSQLDVQETIHILESGWWWKLRRGRAAAHRRLLIEKMKGVLSS